MNTKVLSTCATIVLLTMLIFLSENRRCHTHGNNPGRHLARGHDWLGQHRQRSEARPFATIQHGIDVANQGDTVLVHPGVYRENINFWGKNITVGSLFVTTGDEEHSADCDRRQA